MLYSFQLGDVNCCYRELTIPVNGCSCLCYFVVHNVVVVVDFVIVDVTDVVVVSPCDCEHDVVCSR